MLVAMADDMRVLLIKLADRLHNMRTIAGLPAAKQHRIAQETLDIYAPLAHRLGMQDIRNQLEDLSFATLYPARYAELDHMVAVRSPERDLYLFQVLEEVRERLRELGIEAQISGRPKHLWSIYEKMIVKGRAFEEIHDLVGIRVVVDSVKDCWAALGCIHATWAPVQGRFKDYVSMPKFNLYQSLHTTVIGPQGKPLEVQLRTSEMHLRAEHGVAAHWAYKETGKGSASARARNGDLAWVDRIMDREADSTDPKAFMAALKNDLVIDEIYVFTPKGKVISLARDATPIDFAYAVHTEVGHACQGARVNGRMVPLSHRLQSGDTVEVLTHAGGKPSLDWLKIVVTPRAANKIRQWFSRERREDALASGKDALLRELRRQNLPTQKLPTSVLVQVAQTMNMTDVDALHTAIGENHVSAESVVLRVSRLLAAGSPDQVDQFPADPRHLVRSGRARQGRDRAASNGSAGVHVEGLNDVMVRLSLLLQAAARRRDHRLRHQGQGGVGAPGRLRQRRIAQRAGRPPHRRRVGRSPPGRLHRGHPGGGAGPAQPADGGVQGAVRPAGQHRAGQHGRRRGPGGDHVLRVRAGRCRAAPVDPQHPQAHRRRLRRLPPDGGRPRRHRCTLSAPGGGGPTIRS